MVKGKKQKSWVQQWTDVRGENKYTQVKSLVSESKVKKKKNRQRVYRPGSPFDIRIADRLGVRGVDLLSRVHKRGWVQNWALVESWKRREPGIVGFRLDCQLVSSQ